jgi:hypothetical protein
LLQTQEDYPHADHRAGATEISPALPHSTNRVQAPRVRRQLEQRGFWISHILFYDMTEERFVTWVDAVRELWLDPGGS